MAILCVFLAFFAVVEGQWTVVQPQVGTIMFGLDATAANAGIIAGTSNGVGNTVLSFTNGGETLRPILAGTDQGQPFLILSGQSNGENNNTVITGIGYGRNFPAAAYTVDGGATWAGSSSHDEFLGIWQDCSKTNDNSAYVTTGDWLVYTNQPPAPYGTGVGVSTDGGNVFTLSAIDSWTWDSWARYSAFFNATHGYVSGGYWPLSKSAKVIVGESDEENNGIYQLTQNIHLRDVDDRFIHRRVPKMDGYNAFIAYTSNGGQTWTPLYEEFGDYYFNQIQFVNATVGFVVGEGDSSCVILRTTNAGTTWNVVFTSSYSLVAMKMTSETEGFAGGAVYTGRIISSYFVRTTDGGNTWTEEIFPDLPYSIFNIDGVTGDTAFAVGVNSATTGLLRYNAPVAH